MADQYPIDNPPQTLATIDARPLAEREKSALREAIHAVCLAGVGERGSKLTALLDKIEENNGPKAAFDSLLKLMEFATPKLQRVMVTDGDGANLPAMPVFHVSFNAQAPSATPQLVAGEVILVEPEPNGD